MKLEASSLKTGIREESVLDRDLACFLSRSRRSDGSPNIRSPNVRISISQEDDEEDLMLQLLRDETDLVS